MEYCCSVGRPDVFSQEWKAFGRVGLWPGVLNEALFAVTPPGSLIPGGGQVSVISEGMVLLPRAHNVRHLRAIGIRHAGVIYKIRILRDCRDYSKYEQRRQYCIH